MNDDDMLIICADHGNDPTYTGFDHTREFVPVMVYGKKLKSGVNLGTLSTFSDIAATIAEYLDVYYTCSGKSFLKRISL